MKRLVALALCLLLPSCNLSKRLAKLTADMERRYDGTLPWEQLPQRVISWNQALAIMEKNNTELMQMDNTIRESIRNEYSVYTDMVPGVTYYTFLSSSLRDIAESINSQNASTQINVTFNIPELTHIPYRAYSNKVQSFAAIKAREGKRREIVSKLYALVRKQEIAGKTQLLDQQKSDIERSSRPAEERLGIEKDNTATAWQETATLLGDSSARWSILPESMPHILWEQYRHKLDKLDPLVICNYVMQLERARLAQYNIALYYIPTISTNLYSPSLFSSSGGTYSGAFLSTDDTRINLSINETLDTKLNYWHQYQRSKEAYKLAKRQIGNDMMAHKDKILQLRKSVDAYYQWRSYMQKRIDFIKSDPEPTAEAYIDKKNQLLDMQKELLTQESKAVDSEAAIVLEYGMPE